MSENINNNQEFNTEAMKQAFENLKNSYVGKVLSKTAPKMLNELKELIELLNARNPRIMLIGRRGSGKSSLINAMLGKELLKTGDVIAETDICKWQTVNSESVSLDILDTVGSGQGGSFEGVKGGPINSVQRAISEKCPDMILFLCKAKEVDANIQEDIVFLNKTTEYILGQYSGKGIVVKCVVSQVDELEPKNVKLTGSDNTTQNALRQKKAQNIRIAETHIKQMFSQYSKHNKNVDVIPVCAYMKTHLIDGAKIFEDERWNIEFLLDEVVASLPNQAKMKMARAAGFVQTQRNLAKKVVHIFSATCGVIGAEPIPIADLPVLTSLQYSMIGFIAAISGRKFDVKAGKEFFVAMGLTVGAAFVLREAARALLKIWVGPGNVLSGAIAGAYTEILGNAAIGYFIDKKDVNQLKQLVDEQIRNIRK